MPRTKASKRDDRTPLEKLHAIDDKKIDLFIFFQYYDGLRTDGALGFHVTKEVPPGSTKHWVGIIAQTMTKDQFRGKAKRLILIAQGFIYMKEAPPENLRPDFTLQEVQNLRESSRDKRTIEEKLAQVKDTTELFVFFKYYDGFKTSGEIGFSLNCGPPGSVNHKRSYARFLMHWSESTFRFKAKMLASLAKECIENNYTPSEELRPEMPERDRPWGMINESMRIQGEYA